MQKFSRFLQTDYLGLYWMVWLQFIFLITGVGTTILVNLISYHGGANQSTLIPPLLQYISMLFVYFIPGKDPGAKAPRLGGRGERFLPLICLWDCLAQMLSFFALVTSGSGIYQLVYSSILIMTATLRHFVLGKHLSIQQWLACVVVTAGLFLSSLGLNNGEDVADPADALDAEELIAEEAILSGGVLAKAWTLILPLISTLVYAVEYVMVESYSAMPGAVGPREMCVKCGCFGTAVFSAYFFAFVVPNWDEMVINSIVRAGGSASTVLWSYGWTTLSMFGHNLTYFMLLGTSGAVSTGINQSLRAVLVFVISAICFCEIQASQCFNSFKFLSLCVVICGVLRYAYVTTTLDHGGKSPKFVPKFDKLLPSPPREINV